MNRNISGNDILALADEFRDYWIAVRGVRGLKLDWFVTWRNKVRNTTSSHSNPLPGSVNPLAYVNRNVWVPDDEQLSSIDPCYHAEPLSK